MPQRIRRERGEWFEPEDSVCPPLAEDCPKCLRRWSTAGGFGWVDPQLPGDGVNLGDFLTADGRDFVAGAASDDRAARPRCDGIDELIGDGSARDQVASDAGMSTVEYAVGTVVAAAFAAVLYKIVTGDSVIAGLTNLINTALSTTF